MGKPSVWIGLNLRHNSYHKLILSLEVTNSPKGLIKVDTLDI